MVARTDARRPKYVISDTDRWGRVRWYLRKPGEPKIRLPGGPHHPGFAAAYASAIASTPKAEPIRLAPKPASRTNPGYVYFFRAGSSVKIGYSTRPLHRLVDLRIGHPTPPDSFICVRGTKRQERELHSRMARFNETGEWFAINPELQRLMAQAAAYGVLPSLDGAETEQRGPTG